MRFRNHEIALHLLAVVSTTIVAEVFDIRRARAGCVGPAICATLYLFNSDGEPISVIQGTKIAVEAKNVSSVMTTGSHGCYTIYKRRRFRYNLSEVWIVGLVRVSML